MSTWPSALPRPSIDGYQLAPVNQVVRTDMEVGAARTRRRTFARNDMISVVWLFTDAQMALFRAWFDDPNNAAGGNSWFTVDLAYGDRGLRSREARFNGEWTATPTGGLNWEVTAKLETRGGELTADQIKGALMGLVTASGEYPSLALDFATDKALDSRITFSRASIGTYFDAAGVMQTAIAGAARFDHDPVTHESLGLLIEEARTNLFTYSQLISHASWTKTNCTATLVSSGVAAPDGTFTAYKVVQNTTAAVPHLLTKGATASIGTTYTLSGFFKAAEYNTVTLMLNDNTGARCFNLSTGTSASPPGGETNASLYSMVALGGGWYKCSVTGVSASTGSGVQVRLSKTACTDYNTAGDGTSGIYVWGFQFEAGAFPTSYIPTTSATVARSADLASMTGVNFTSWFNSTAGTFFADAKSAGLGAGNPRIIGASSSALSGALFITTANPVSFGTWNSAHALNYTNAAGTFAAGAKAAMTYSTSGRSITKGGSTPVSDAYPLIEGANTATDIVIGYGAGGTLNGTVKRIAYYPTSLSNAELQALTV